MPLFCRVGALCVCVASLAWLLLGVCPAWWLAFLSVPLMLKGEVALQRPCDLLQLSLCFFCCLLRDLRLFWLNRFVVTAYVTVYNISRRLVSVLL